MLSFFAGKLKLCFTSCPGKEHFKASDMRSRTFVKKKKHRRRALPMYEEKEYIPAGLSYTGSEIIKVQKTKEQS